MSRAEATVNIEVKGALQGALEVRTLNKALDKLDRQGKKLSSGARTMQSFSQNLTTAGVKTRKVFDSMDKGVKMMGTALTKGLMLALKSTLLQFGLFSAALMGIHALFIAGKWLHKAYSFGMTAMAGAAASAAVAIGVATAAVREQQAAMHAYTAGGAGEYITGTNQVRVAMRTLQADAQLAGLGVEALNKAYASMAKSMKSSQIAQSGAMIKNLMDFGAAGQDPAAAADKVGALIEALNNSKTSMASVKQAAKALGPQMEKALKDAKVTSKKQMKELIMSGELAKAGGVAGQFEAVNSTLIGQAKSFFNLLKVEFGDFGQQFLEPAKVAMQKIFRIIRTDLVRVSGAMSDFADASFFDGIVSGVEKVSNFFVKFIREWLPKTDGFFKNMAGGWEKFARWFRISKEQLKPFVEGARAIEGIFKPILSALKSGFLDSFKDFNEGAISNKETFAEIGKNLGSLITELFRLQEVFTQAFSDALPFLSDVIKGVTEVVGMMASLLSKFSSVLGGPMAYMALLILGRQMKGTTGGFLGKERAPVNTMTVTARSVIVNGGRPGGPGGPGGPPAGPGGPPAGPGRPGGPGGPGGTPPGTPPTGPIPVGPQRPPIPTGPIPIGPQRPPIIPTGGVRPTSGDILYDRHGSPLYGGRRHPGDTRTGEVDRGGRQVTWGRDYPNPDAKLVGRGAWVTRNGKTYWNPGAFAKKTPGTGDVGTTGRGGAPYPPAPTAGSSTRPIMMAHQGYQYINPTPSGPSSPIDGLRLSTGAGAGGGAGGGGMPGPGGPGTAPAGAGGPGTQGAFSRRGFWGRISDASRRQAQGNTGVGAEQLFRTKITGRQYAAAEQDASGNYTGRVMNMTREIDPVTGQRVVSQRQGATYDPQTGFVSTKGMGFRNKIKYSGLTTRSIRNSALGSSILGNDEKGIGGINRSMGAKMGVGMGMGIASQYMAPEAQGAMAMGAMVGQFNPLAGLAVGLGGAALNSRTAAGGAMTGAGAGAAIGTMIAPGIGTAVGAALGAITGAVAGFAGGMRQRAKESKEAMGSFLDGISTRQFQEAKDKILRQEADAAQGVDMTGRTGAYEEIAGETAAAYGNLSETLKARGFSGDYGKSTWEQTKSGMGTGAAVGGGLGVATGAIAGSVGGPIGSLVTAATFGSIGAVLGGVVGGITGLTKGLFGRGERKRKQEKDYKILKEISEDPAFKGIISPEEMAAISKDKGAGLTKLAKELPERLKAADAISQQQGHRMKLLKDMSGKSGAEIEVLAKKMGVDLYDATLKTSDIVEQLGLTMVKTAKEMKEANTDVSVAAIATGFDEIIKRVQAPEIYDERGTALGDTVRGGGDTLSVLNALKSFQESSIGMDPYGNAVTDFYNQQAQIGTLANPGALFQAGGAWADIDPAKFFTPRVTEALTKTATETETGLISNAATQIQGQLGTFKRYGNTSKITEKIQSMTPENRERFLTDVESGIFQITDPFAGMTDAQAKELYTSKGAKSKAHYQGMLLNDQFANYGATGNNLIVRSQDNKKTNAVGNMMKTASTTFKTAVEKFSKDMGTYFGPEAAKPEWWSKEAMADIMPDDTSTPRGGIVGDTTSSRLSQTMDRHNAVNSSIAGKRTITSSYRTTGLGSLNSDHVTGRAIDIVGQNLGSYAVATRNAGGFAEFHGSGDRRHLHAVPGPGVIGDTLTPSSNQMSAPTTATVASGGSSFTFHINGGQNSPEEIANMVMAKIKTTEQRVRERR